MFIRENLMNNDAHATEKSSMVNDHMDTYKFSSYDIASIIRNREDQGGLVQAGDQHSQNDSNEEKSSFTKNTDDDLSDYQLVRDRSSFGFQLNCRIIMFRRRMIDIAGYACLMIEDGEKLEPVSYQ